MSFFLCDVGSCLPSIHGGDWTSKECSMTFWKSSSSPHRIDQCWLNSVVLLYLFLLNLPWLSLTHGGRVNSTKEQVWSSFRALGPPLLHHCPKQSYPILLQWLESSLSHKHCIFLVTLTVMLTAFFSLLEALLHHFVLSQEQEHDIPLCW
jgi:hypothetical protein